MFDVLCFELTGAEVNCGFAFRLKHALNIFQLAYSSIRGAHAGLLVNFRVFSKKIRNFRNFKKFQSHVIQYQKTSPMLKFESPTHCVG